MKVVIAGGSGFLGNALAWAWAEESHDVRVLTRALPAGQAQHESGTGKPGITRIGWNPDGHAGSLARELEGASALDQPRRRTHRRRPLDRGAQAGPPRQPDPRDPVTRAPRSPQTPDPPPTFVSGSGIGYYGDRGAETLTEASSPGDDFLAHLCVEWEAEARRAAAVEVRRLVLLRTGLVLEKSGGLLPQMMRPFRFFAGGPIGSGRQYMPWVHRLDWIEMVRWIVDTPAVSGPVNVSAPHPVTNAEFSRALGRAMHRPALLPAARIRRQDRPWRNGRRRPQRPARHPRVNPSHTAITSATLRSTSPSEESSGTETMRMKISVIAVFVAIGCWAAGDTVRGSARAAQECEYHVSPTRVGVDGSAQSAVVQVDTAPGCAWTATADAGWLTITAGSSGTGPGSISYAVAPFAPSSDFPIRQGHVQVRWNTPTAGQNVQVTQSTGTCNAAFSPAPGPTSAVTFGALGGGGNAWVLAESFLTGPWFVDGASDWITPTSPPLGVLRGGDGQAFFAVSPNPSSAPRDGAIRFCSGQTMDVHQAGRVPNQGPFVPSDFDGDGIADLAVFRPATGTWFVLQSHSGYSYSDARTYAWGQAGDMPVPGDFDGDALTDLAVFRPQGLFGAAPAGNWNIRYSSNQFNPATATSVRLADLPFRSAGRVAARRFQRRRQAGSRGLFSAPRRMEHPSSRARACPAARSARCNGACPGTSPSPPTSMATGRPTWPSGAPRTARGSSAIRRTATAWQVRRRSSGASPATCRKRVTSTATGGATSPSGVRRKAGGTS